MAVMILFYINTLFLLKALIVERRHGDKSRHYFLFKRKDGLDRDEDGLDGTERCRIGAKWQ